MSTTLLLVRHGETEWNRGKIFRGTHDVPLNENGRKQASLVASALKGVTIHAAYTSPLSRAKETAEIALKNHKLGLAVSDGLLDFNYGDWTGLQDTKVARTWPEEHALWTSQPHTVRVPNGDTLHDVFIKAFDAVEGIASEHEGQTVALFSHRVVNKLLVLGFLGLGLERFPLIVQGNCCINKVEKTAAGYIIHYINDTSHIRHANTGLLEADF
jgi:broad specificity phosphatase PhoE